MRFFRILLVFLAVCLTPSLSFADAQSLKTEQIEASAAAEALEVVDASLPNFPASSPAGAIRGVFAWFDDQFEIFFWRQNSHAWIEIRPINSVPFICSSGFHVVSGGVQYDTVKVTTRNGNSQCDDQVVASAVYLFTQWAFYENKANLSKAFTLVFEGGRDKFYTLAVPAAPSSNDGGGCFIRSVH